MDTAVEGCPCCASGRECRRGERLSQSLRVAADLRSIEDSRARRYKHSRAQRAWNKHVYGAAETATIVVPNRDMQFLSQ